MGEVRRISLHKLSSMGENKPYSNPIWVKEACFLGTEVKLEAPVLAWEEAGGLMHRVKCLSLQDGGITRAFGKSHGKHEKGPLGQILSRSY